MILDSYDNFFKGAIGNNLFLMDENSRRHRVALMTDYLKGGRIQKIEWLTYSLNLILIEYVLDAL